MLVVSSLKIGEFLSINKFIWMLTMQYFVKFYNISREIDIKFFSILECARFALYDIFFILITLIVT